MKKKEKFTQVYFNEADPVMEIDTHNTNLKHRLTAFARQYPDLCRIVSDGGEGRMSFEIDKIIKTKFDPLQGKYTEITIGTPRRTLPKRLAAMERRMQA